MVHDPYIRIYVYIYVGLLRSTDSKTANTRLGATKPQTKANTTATRVSRGSKRGVSSAREGWNYQGIVARLQSGGEQTFSNWTRVIIRRRTFSTFSSNWENFDERRSHAFPPTRGSYWFLWTIVTWKKKSSRIVKGLKFTCNLHSRSWIARWETWIDLVQEIGQLGRLWRVLKRTWTDLWIRIEWVWLICILFFFDFLKIGTILRKDVIY